MKLKLIACIATFSTAFGATVVESFSGATTLDETGKSSVTGGTMPFVVTSTSGCVDIQFTITLTSSTNNVVVDNNINGSGVSGFGSANSGFTADDHTFTFSIGSFSASLNGTAPVGSAITGNTLSANFTGFTMLNNGTQAPVVEYTAGSVSDAVIASAPQTAGNATPISFTGDSGASLVLMIDRAGNTPLTTQSGFAWFNDFDVAFSGGVTVDKVPEPTGAALLGLGGLALITRRGRK